MGLSWRRFIYHPSVVVVPGWRRASAYRRQLLLPIRDLVGTVPSSGTAPSDSNGHRRPLQPPKSDNLGARVTLH
eukprot:4792223-Pyramimonas_sp.AAC.1